MSLISWLRNWKRTDAGGRIRSQTCPRKRPTCLPKLEELEDRCLLSGGVLDPTFGSGGWLTTGVGSYYRTYAVATDPNDGKIVVAGGSFSFLQHGNTTTLVRYNLDGTLDTRFGSGGVVAQVAGLATDVKIQPDGKIVSTNGVSVIRYNADGTLDRTFGGKGANGQVGTGLNSIGARVILQADGKIVVAGSITPRKTQDYDLGMVRYNTDGTLDTTYGAGGKVIQHFAFPIPPYLQSGDTIHLAVDPGTGKIVALVELEQGPAVLVRFNTNGSLDASLAGAGYEAVFPSPFYPRAVAIQPDGRIVLSGTVNSGASTGSDLALERYSASGALDTTFGSGGVVVVPLPGVQVGLSLALQPDGKILVAGKQDWYNFLVARFNAADGSLDTSFGVDGVAVSGSIQNPSQPGLVVAPDSDYAVYVALEPDGRIVLAGTRDYNSTGTGQYQVALARFLTTGPQLGTFTASPNPATVGSSVTLTASNVAPLNPGSSVTKVAFYADSNGDGILDAGDALLGSGTQPGAGAWTFTFSTTGWASGGTTLFAQATDSYGVFSDPLALTLQVL